LNALAAGRVVVTENVLTEVRDALTDRLLRSIASSNLVVDAGLNQLRDLLDATIGSITHFAVGTSATAPANGQTALVAEVYRNTVTQRVKASASVTQRCFVASSAANGNTLREAALLNAPSAGTMFSRVTHDDIVKTISITVTHAWTHTFARA
jgi:hypothetical protein